MLPVSNSCCTTATHPARPRTSGLPGRLLPTHLPLSLLKVLACYVAAILLLQGLAAAMALGAGPLHRHQPVHGSTASLVFSHHAHSHATGQRHDHALADTTVVQDAAEQAAADAAALALSAALSLLALQSARAALASHRHVLMAARAWFWRSLAAGTLYRPPRHA